MFDRILNQIKSVNTLADNEDKADRLYKIRDEIIPKYYSSLSSEEINILFKELIDVAGKVNLGSKKFYGGYKKRY